MFFNISRLSLFQAPQTQIFEQNIKSKKFGLKSDDAESFVWTNNNKSTK